MRGSHEAAKLRFREFADHTRQEGHTRPHAYRDGERHRTIIYCATCHEEWPFKDVTLREMPYLLDYFRSCGLESLIDPILNFQPLPGAWGKVLLGFLDET